MKSAHFTEFFKISGHNPATNTLKRCEISSKQSLTIKTLEYVIDVSVDFEQASLSWEII